MSEVCNNISIEPHLQPLSDEASCFKTASSESNAQLDIAVNGFWEGRYECSFFDVRVFNPKSAMRRRRDVRKSSMCMKLSTAILLHSFLPQPKEWVVLPVRFTKIID